MRPASRRALGAGPQAVLSCLLPNGRCLLGPAYAVPVDGSASPVIPVAVSNKALAVGASGWLAGLHDLVASLAREWSLTLGSAFDDATEGLVTRAWLADGTPTVLKIHIPRSFDAAREEILRCSGTQFDPAVVEVFLKIPNELWHELRSEITGQNKRFSTFDINHAPKPPVM